MIESDYPISGADLHWLIREVEAAHRVPLARPLDTEEMRYNPIPSVDAEYWRKQRTQERASNTVTERELAPWNRMLIVGAVVVVIALWPVFWGWIGEL